MHLQKALDSLRSLAAFSTRALLCLCSTLPLQLLRPSLINIIGLIGTRRIKNQTRNGLTSLSCCILTCETFQDVFTEQDVNTDMIRAHPNDWMSHITTGHAVLVVWKPFDHHPNFSTCRNMKINDGRRATNLPL